VFILLPPDGNKILLYRESNSQSQLRPMPNGRWFLPVLTINAAGLVDVDAGELITPGVLRIEGDRIVGVGPSADRCAHLGPPGDLP
jgi:hypothetical protein